jgi:hypothetical protein
MTDGRNNRPFGSADTDLQEKIDFLNAEGIPVYVTCTGDDDGLDSQCAEIAAGTGGTYVDSADAGEMPERFVGLYELTKHRSPSQYYMDYLFERRYEQYDFYVEKGADAVTFALLWQYPELKLEMEIKKPDGNFVDPKEINDIPLGQYYRVEKPDDGLWVILVRGGQETSSLLEANDNFSFVVRGYIENQKINVAAGVRKRVVPLGSEILVCARPLDELPLLGVNISGNVFLPSGKMAEKKEDQFFLHDDGSMETDSGDEIAEDGIYCGTFRDTKKERGAYLFRMKVNAMGEEVVFSKDVEPGFEDDLKDMREPTPFMRAIEFSATVDDNSEKPLNIPPIANAGSDQTIECVCPTGRTVTLDGSKSYDEDSGPSPLSYTWEGPFGILTGSVINPTLALGVHNILLTVDDGKDKDTEGIVVAIGDVTADITPDHFLCYKARQTRKTERFIPVEGVLLKDQFDSKKFDIRKPVELCNPVNKNNEGIKRPETHLVDYLIRRSEGEARLDRLHNVRVDNQFGTLFIKVLKPVTLLVPSAKDLQQEPKPLEEARTDHFKCYKVKPRRGVCEDNPTVSCRNDIHCFRKGLEGPCNTGKIKAAVELQDQFNKVPKRFIIRKPTRLCTPVTKEHNRTVTEMRNPDAHLMCYRIAPIKGEPRFGKIKNVFINNQFGPLQLDVKKELELCVPSIKTLTQ